MFKLHLSYVHLHARAVACAAGRARGGWYQGPFPTGVAPCPALSFTKPSPQGAFSLNIPTTSALQTEPTAACPPTECSST